jgi:inorganic pyrophosphatase
MQMLIQATAGSPDRRLYDERKLVYRDTWHGTKPYPYAYGFIVGTMGEHDECVDCYLITRDAVEAGAIVECEPLALLEQHEGSEIDHKVLAALPGQDVEVGEELVRELREFINALFAEHPNVSVRVGPLHPVEEALRYIQEHRKYWSEGEP